MKDTTKKNGAVVIEGHLQGLSNTRSLGEKGIPVYVVDNQNCIAQYSKYCTKFFQSPGFICDDFATFLINLAKKEDIKDWVLIPSNDHAVYTISKHKNELEKYYRIITPGIEIIDSIYDKTKLIEIANNNGIPVPVTQTFTSTKERVSKQLTFPLLTKGKNGLSFYKASGKKGFLAHNKKELRKQLSFINDNYDIAKTFTQEYIPFDGNNKTISFTAFSDNGEIKAHWTGIKLREHPARFGTATFTMSTYVKECYQYSQKLLKALNYVGVCEIEYIKDPRTNEYKLIEMNPRTWLWVDLAKACGVDYAKMIYDYAHSKKIEYQTGGYNTLYWINPVTDTAYSIISIFKGKHNPLSYIKSLLKGKKIDPLFKKNDPKPGLQYLLKVFHFFHTR